MEAGSRYKLLLMGPMRSWGTGAPEAMYLKMRAWCSSSCHCDAVNGHLLLLPFIISAPTSGNATTRWIGKERGVREREGVSVLIFLT